MSQNLVVDVLLETPVIFGENGLMGDSALAGIAYREHHDHERAIRELPIETFEGVARISQALCYVATSRKKESVTMTQSFMRYVDHDADLADDLIKMPSRSMRTPSQGPLSNLQNTYRTHHVSNVFFIGRGDIGGVRRWMQSTPAIGSQNAKGYGQIVRVEVWPSKSDNPWYGMIGAREGRNTVLRLRHLFPAQLDFVESTETWHCPYFPGHESAVLEPCMVSPFVVGEGFSPDDIEMFGQLA
jgi:hypothetical protein